MKKLIIALILLFASPVMAANLAVLPTGAGAKNGADWSNALDWSATAGNAFTRGNTYFIGGSDTAYAAKRLYTAVSGTDVITIQKARAGDASSGLAGWSADFGTKQAVFDTGMNITTAYWNFDGVVGSGSDPTAYGFKVFGVTDDCLSDVDKRIFGVPGVGYSSSTPTDVTIAHTAIISCGKIGGGDGVQVGIYSNSTSALTNVIIDSCYLANGSANLLFTNWSTGCVVQDTYFNANWSSASNHGQQVSNHGDDVTFKGNTFKDSQVAVLSSHPAADNPDERNLLFNNLVIGGNVEGVFVNGNSGSAPQGVKSWEVHHNTVDGVTVGAKGFLYVTQLADEETEHSHSYNNLFYNSTITWNTNTLVIHDYNAYIDNTGSITETNKQTGTGDPFTNSAGGDYTLKSGTVPIDHGTALAATYATDRAGVSRPQSTGWDIGAYEYTGGAATHTITFTTATGCTASKTGTATEAEIEQTVTITNGYGYTCTASGCGGTFAAGVLTYTPSGDCTVTTSAAPHFATLGGSGTVTLGGSGTACLVDLVSITYDGNGSDGGTVPTSPQYCPSLTATVLGNTGTLTKTGYTFDGWNTAADGSGTSYAADATFTISGNTTLYAKWIIPPFSPSDIAGLLAWHAADEIVGLSDGDPVVTWEDLTANNKDFTQATAGYRPLYKTNIVNGKPALLFDGSDDLMATAILSGAKTVVIVAKATGETFADYKGLITGSSTIYLIGDSGQDHWYIAEGPDGRKYYKDGVETSDAVTNAWHVFALTFTVATSEILQIARTRTDDGARWWPGYIAEVVVYDSVISGTDFTNLMSYLKSKYGTP